MRLPRPEELTTDAERKLYEHDVVEYHAPGGIKSFVRLGYLRRLEVMKSLISEFIPSTHGESLKILDVGCAQGNLALLLAEAGHDVVAADLRPEFLHYVRKKYERGRLSMVALNAERLPFEPVFDLVILGELLEHAAHPDRLLMAAGKVLKPGGAILVTTPNGKFFLNHLPTYSEVGPGGALESKQFEPDGDGHLFLLTASELIGLVESVGMRVGAVRYFNSPFATGVAKWRCLGRWLPTFISRVLEILFSNIPWIRTRFCSGFAALAKLPADKCLPAGGCKYT